jgi:hypothetical protein
MFFLHPSEQIAVTRMQPGTRNPRMAPTPLRRAGIADHKVREVPMFKRIFRFSYDGEPASRNGEFSNGANRHAIALADAGEGAEAPAEAAPAPAAAKNRKPAAAQACTEHEEVSFSQIYEAAAISTPATGYNILKVAEMVNSPHVAELTADAKRCSVLMALEAAGVKLEELLQDGVFRQRALNDHEAARQRSLQEFEAEKAEANRKLQEELDRLTADYMRMMQANLDEVAREQDCFRAWQRRKQQESQRIAEAAAFCVPANGQPGSLAAVLERATASLK